MSDTTVVEPKEEVKTEETKQDHPGLQHLSEADRKEILALREEAAARRIKAKEAMEELERLRITTLKHPLTPQIWHHVIFWLFPRLKTALSGQNFENSAQLDLFVKNWCSSLTSERFRNCLEKLKERYRKCITVNGEYFEHKSDE